MYKIRLDIQKFASVQTDSYEGRYLKLTVVEESTSIENNTSTIRWTLESIGGSSSYYTIYNWGVTIAGQTIYAKQTTNWSTEKFPAKKGTKTGTITIEHNADGTASNVAFTLTGKVYSSGTATFNGSIPLTTIPRASQPTISANPTLGSAITINTNRVSSVFTHIIRYTFGNITDTIATNVTDSTSWTPAISLAQQITSSTTGTGTIYCDTYQNGTLIGTKSVGFTATVPSSIVPTISNVSIEEAGSTPSAWGIFLKSKSKIKTTITASGNQGSSISSYNSNVANSSFIYNGTANNYTTGFLTKTGTYNIITTATDTRGRTSAQNTKSYTCVDYNPPSIATAEVKRVNTSGTDDDQGTRVKYTFSASVASASNKNTPNYKLSYHEVGSSTWYTVATWGGSAGSNYSINQTATITNQGGNFDPTKEYEFKFETWDYFTTSAHTIITRIIETGFDLMNFNSSGKSMAIGGVSTRGASEEVLDLNIKTSINGTIETKGNYDAPWYLFKKIIDLTDSGYGRDTYYPVTSNSKIPNGGLHRIMEAVQLNSGVKPTWATHTAGFTSIIDVMATAGGWGTTHAKEIVLEDDYAHSNGRPAWYTQLTNSSKACFYLRGGGKYFIYTDFLTEWTIYTSSTTISSQTVAPTTTVSSNQINKSTIEANLSGNATSADSATNATTFGNGSMKVYGESNEINFGGTNTNGNIYFGYRAKDSRPKPSNFWLGDGSSNLYGRAQYDANGYGLTVTSGTTGVTRGAGSSTITNQQWLKYGRMIHLYVNVITSGSVASGSDIMTGTISTALYPKQVGDGVGYLGARAIIFRVRPDGSFTIRNAGSTSISSGSSISVSVAYISNS